MPRADRDVKRRPRWTFTEGAEARSPWCPSGSWSPRSQRIATLAHKLLDASTLYAIATVSPGGRAHVNTDYFAHRVPPHTYQVQKRV
jgi:hypothetical protein